MEAVVLPQRQFYWSRFVAGAVARPRRQLIRVEHGHGSTGLQCRRIRHGRKELLWQEDLLLARRGLLMAGRSNCS